MTTRAAIIGLLIACCYLGFEFGAEIARYRAMSAALAEVETCETDGECERAWAEFRAIGDNEQRLFGFQCEVS